MPYVVHVHTERLMREEDFFLSVFIFISFENFADAIQILQRMRDIKKKLVEEKREKM